MARDNEKGAGRMSVCEHCGSEWSLHVVGDCGDGYTRGRESMFADVLEYLAGDEWIDDEYRVRDVRLSLMAKFGVKK